MCPADVLTLVGRSYVHQVPRSSWTPWPGLTLWAYPLPRQLNQWANAASFECQTLKQPLWPSLALASPCVVVLSDSIFCSFGRPCSGAPSKGLGSWQTSGQHLVTAGLTDQWEPS